MGIVRGPDDALGTDQRRHRAERALVGIEGDPALPLEVLARLGAQLGSHPAVDVGEVIEAIEPVRQLATTALEHRDLELRMPL